jgi:RsiW-degrading membrane proteinase PrsW (M82 family)
MSLSREVIYVLQLIAIIIAGGFIGEFYRTSNSDKFMSHKEFIANLLAGGFLSFVLAYLYFYLVGDRKISFLLGGVLSYQNVKTINGFIVKLIKNYLKQLSGK